MRRDSFYEMHDASSSMSSITLESVSSLFREWINQRICLVTRQVYTPCAIHFVIFVYYYIYLFRTYVWPRTNERHLWFVELIINYRLHLSSFGTRNIFLFSARCADRIYFSKTSLQTLRNRDFAENICSVSLFVITLFLSLSLSFFREMLGKWSCFIFPTVYILLQFRSEMDISLK